METSEQLKLAKAKPRCSILKNGGPCQHEGECSHPETDHVKFDEYTIAEHDKERGTRTKISEPKTPYQEAEEADVEMHDCSQSEKVADEEIRHHLQEAERNKALNAQL